MQNEKVLVVGGSSGMGLALARMLLGEGAEVHIAGRSADRLTAAARSLGVPGERSLGVPGKQSLGVPGVRSLGVPGERSLGVPGMQNIDEPGERSRDESDEQRIDKPGGQNVGEPGEGSLRESGRLHLHSLDIGDETRVREVVSQPFDHVVVTAADAQGAYRPIGEFPLEAAKKVLDTKLLGPWLVAKHAAPHLRPGGSITFTSGIAAYRPGPGSSVLATANGALETLARTLALELAPIRVNTVSPGWVDTPVWEALAGAAKGERLAAMAARLPVGRIGTPEDIAAVFRAVMTNGFITGTVIHADGGHRLV